MVEGNAKITGLRVSRQRHHYPRSFNIGTVLLNSGFAAEAEPYLEKALEEMEVNFYATVNLGICKRHLAEFDQAENLFLNAIGLDKNSPLAWGNYGMLHEDLGRFTLATSTHRTAFVKAPNNPQLALNFATALMRQGKWQEAWSLWEFGRSQHRASFPNLPRWNGRDDLTDKKILICREGGFGDAILFMRWFKDLKDRGAHITFWVWDSLIPLLEDHAWIDELIPASDGVSLVDDTGRLRYDYMLPLMSLPAALNLEDPTGYRKYIESFHQQRPITRIGICWKAEEDFVARKHRSIPDVDVNDLILQTEFDVDWLSLVPNDPVPAEGTHSFLTKGVRRDNTPEPVYWDATADAIKSCDLVISVDTAVAHLAGSMAKETWLLLPKRSDWKWGTRQEPHHWYPRMRYFYQDDPVLWNKTIQKVKEALIERQRGLSE